MAYAEELASRVRAALDGRADTAERRMMGGIVWMVRGHMAVGVMGGGLLVRLAPEALERALAEGAATPLEMGGRRARGFAVVPGGAVAGDAELERWIDAGVAHASSLPTK